MSSRTNKEPSKRGTSKRAARVRYAVVGLGHIAQVAVLPAFEHARKNSRLVGLFSDDPVKLKKLGRKYGVEHTWGYDQYDEALASGVVDAVYVAVPNHLHRDFTVRAAQARVHVLCEKPLAITEHDCEVMIGACRDNDVRLMTAYRLHFERANLKAVDIVKSGKLGEPRIFDSVFTMQVTDEDNIRLRRETGGGPLWDIGIYCINASRYLFQSEPVEVTATTIHSDEPRFAEVEEGASVILRFPEERIATFACSFNGADVSRYEVVGTKGSLRLDPAYEYAGELRQTVTIGKRKREQVFAKRDQFGPELLYFSDCVLNHVDPEPSGREGLADVRVIRAAYRSADKGYPIELPPFQKRRRPEMEQEIHSPPVQKPREIRAESPSED